MMFRLAYMLSMMLLPRFLPRILRYLRLIWRLIFDRRVNIILRALVPLAILYALSPIDLIRDNIPIVGRFDDLVVMGLAILLLIKLSPPDVVNEHLGKIPESDSLEDEDPSKVVDGKARFIDDED